MSADEFGDLFNSRLEAGIRAVVILESIRPQAVDLTEMVLLDCVVVHTADLGGPPSLHAPLPARRGELLVRRRLVEAGLDLMARCHLVDRADTVGGLAWRASDEAAAYVDLLQSPYSTGLKDRAGWIAVQVSEKSHAGFMAFARSELGGWGEAFTAVGGGRGDTGAA